MLDIYKFRRSLNKRSNRMDVLCTVIRTTCFIKHIFDIYKFRSSMNKQSVGWTYYAQLLELHVHVTLCERKILKIRSKISMPVDNCEYIFQIQ